MKLLSLAEAGEVLGLDASRLRRLIYAGALRAQKVGAAWVVSEREVQRFAALVRPSGRPRKLGKLRSDEGER